MKFTFILSTLLFGHSVGQNVVEVAVGAPTLFSTLVDLVVTAGLDGALSTADDITVFAPTNDAFGKLNQQSLEVLKSDQYRPHLQNLLLQHVLPTEVPSSAITDGLAVAALNEEDVKLTLSESGGVIVNNIANVIQADVPAENGVIHAIDTVLFPEWVRRNIYNIASTDQDLTVLMKLISELHLATTLSIRGPFTIFAPTDEAFREGLALLGEEDGILDFLSAAMLFTYHVVYGVVSSEDIENGLELKTALGEEIRFSFLGDVPQVNGKNIIATDILANNGVVHKIDGLLIPESLTADPETPTNTVVDVAIGNSDAFSILVDFVTQADLVAPLTNTLGITVLAPTDDAFAEFAFLAPTVAANLLTDEWSTHLQDVLLYHVLAFELPSSAITNGSKAPALNGENLSLTVNGNGIFVNSESEVIIADVGASNGIIHAIDTVLIPSWVSNTIVDRAVGSPLLTTLVDLVVQAGLADTLSGEGPFTVFAPTDDAFVEFLGEGVDLTSLDMELVSSILTYHVVPGIYAASEIENGLDLTTVQGEDITFTTMGSTAMVNGEKIVATDILANNGIVHVIDGVLIPMVEPVDPENVVDVAIANSDTFSTLVDFVVKADLVSALASTQAITVFAPTNDAFAALASVAPNIVANFQTDQWSTHLQDVLLYHVLPEIKRSSTITDGSFVTSLNEEALTFSVNGDGIFVDAAEVVLADVGASNGVIHAIDSVLIPSWASNTIVDRALDYTDLSTLVDLVAQANLVETLNGEGPFTVFAPTNDAFVEFLGAEGIDSASSLDIDLLLPILTYHVVPGIYAASDIVNGLSLTTVQGEDIVFTLMGDTGMVNGETILHTDILANNGVVHVLDGVLIPMEVTAPVTMMEYSMPQAVEQNTLAMIESEQVSSASSYGTSVAAATAAVMGFGAAIGVVF